MKVEGIELGDSAESEFDSIRQNFDSIYYCCITRGWGHLWTVVCIVKCTRKIINSYLCDSCRCTIELDVHSESEPDF